MNIKSATVLRRKFISVKILSLEVTPEFGPIVYRVWNRLEGEEPD